MAVRRQEDAEPRYIACNADESEPGTFKDHVLMERNPHLLFEGCLIGCWAIGAKVAYIYIRGEFFHVQKVMEAELAKAYAQGYAGKNIMGTGCDCDIVIHRGAGAYEAGEETALIESLEGKRAQPRIKPPFPAVSGLYNKPDRGQQRRDALQPAADPDATAPNGSPVSGPRRTAVPSCSASAATSRQPGTFEASMQTTLRELIYDAKYAGGIRDGHQLKAVIPGGSSVPMLLDRPARRRRVVRRRGEGRIDAGLGRHHRHGRDHLHGLGGEEPALFLQARVVRQVHAVPRGRRLAATSS